MSRTVAALILTSYLTACGGGGGGGSTPAPEPPITDPDSEPTTVVLLDSVPGPGVTNVEPEQLTSSFAHLGHSDLSLELSSDCSDFAGTTIRRDLFDLSVADFDQLLDHKIKCSLEENTSYTITANGTRSNDAEFTSELFISTGVTNPSGLTVINEFNQPRDTVNDMFIGYIDGAFFEDLDLPSGIESLVRGLVLEIAEANWGNLVDPDSLYDVTSQQVSYLSRHPDGSPSAELTAAITFPVIASASDFVTRDRAIILTHATGSTPGDLDNTDAWYILANLFASRGYLVIAPDNYGRGGTGSSPETYLMANRTALNTLDLVNQVLEDTAYDDVYNGSDLAIIGYSQGGHSAVGLHLLLETQGPENLSIRETYAGGAPHNLYQTVRGVMQHLDGSCDDGAYCRYVDEDTTVPFATDRIFPGFLSYTNTGLLLEDVVTGEEINPEFVTAFLANDPELDNFKAMLQLSSFAQIVSAGDNFSSSNALVHLYHSQFDRLVPFANTSELAAVLEPAVTVDFHENRCNSDGYEAIFNLTDKVGVLHTLCGLSVLDDALADFK
ncbi:MAG: alpha/beta fold hydrolase [Gammaproteobacteria bacterium]|jgi:pimeloyl-ACP methyl ester carboxylesterase|nr:alpha/beta fold hydrolase [Gammaproteobacteria bacterium]MBT3868342.1 alpha/beta fold hydrolase [Gammaproteobacteria bacterium]MBT4380844.1 alpha/beta fold hydrolase [Gammaproteobacteria bacterium]MBT4615675.1 alpha/beta fold hydrolase [Gammaproteobacteria bacterium]MBT5199201.1 alpha/beta fold hydrolase [Gammaproteobacteria bacterium]